MTKQKNAARAATQSVLTDEDRRQLLVRANYPQLQEDPRAYLVKITEELVLSKLRAAGVQAGDERVAFEDAWRQVNAPIPMNVRLHADGRYFDADIEKGWRLWQARAALASAPIAGEPFMYGIMGPDRKAHFEEFCVSGDRSELQTEVVDHLNRDNPEDGTYSVVALFHEPAPQASEAVRNAGLEEAAAALENHQRAGREWVPGSLWDTLSREAGARIRALKTQPGKDGGGHA